MNNKALKRSKLVFWSLMLLFVSEKSFIRNTIKPSKGLVIVLFTRKTSIQTYRRAALDIFNFIFRKIDYDKGNKRMTMDIRSVFLAPNMSDNCSAITVRNNELW